MVFPWEINTFPQDKGSLNYPEVFLKSALLGTKIGHDSLFWPFNQGGFKQSIPAALPRGHAAIALFTVSGRFSNVFLYIKCLWYSISDTCMKIKAILSCIVLVHVLPFQGLRHWTFWIRHCSVGGNNPHLSDFMEKGCSIETIIFLHSLGFHDSCTTPFQRITRSTLYLLHVYC